jgi:hypothetical protein
VTAHAVLGALRSPDGAADGPERRPAATVRHVSQGAAFTDEELLAVLDRARGDQRVQVVVGLRISVGSRGVARLLELVDP